MAIISIEFTLPFETEASVTIKGEQTEITIVGVLNDSIRTGSEVVLSMTYELAPGAIPAWALPTEVISWIDHNGVDIGSGNSISYYPAEDGPQSVEVRVTLEDISDPIKEYRYEFTQDYSYTVTQLESSTRIYEFQYQSSNGILRYDNMDIMRAMTYFPKWSSTYKSHFSNTSKILSPHFERVSFHTNDLDNILANNQTLHGRPSYEYSNTICKILTIRKPNYIKTEYGFCYHLGENSSMSIDSVPIGAFKRTIANPINFIDVGLYAGTQKVRLPKATVIYVQSPVATFQNQETVTISGISSRGNYISEEILLDSALPVEAINRYHMITSFSGNTEELRVSNFINHQISHVDRTALSKRIVNSRGIYFTPLFELDGNILHVLNGDLVAKNEEYKFILPYAPDRLLISNLLDVMLVYNNSLYCSKLFLDYTDLTQPNSSMNNNDFIWVNDENAAQHEEARLTINTDLLKADYPGSSIRISIKNNGEITYITSKSQLSSSRDSWILLSNTGNRISMVLNIDNDAPYEYGLEISNHKHIYYAMISQNKLDFIKVEEDVSDIYIHDKALYFIDQAGNTTVAKPIRLGFTTDDSYSYLHFPFKEIEVLYND